jgi:hypothetical protein
LIFPTAYLPPLKYFNDFINDDHAALETGEHFVKQTLRNRCYIYGPNGKQALIIPVKHERLSDKPISEVEISFDARWNKIHWRSLTAAYRNSPFFEFYEDDFSKIYHDPPERLFDFNLSMIELLIKAFDIRKKILMDSVYNNADEARGKSLYEPGENFPYKKYHQVFEERHGFIGGLSIIDLLFNEGIRSEKIQRASER